MAYTFTQLTNIKDRIVADLATQQNNIDSAKTAFTTIKSNLTTMQTTYAGWTTEVDTLYTSNSSDPAIAALKAEKDLLVAEFQSSKTLATNLETAVATV